MTRYNNYYEAIDETRSYLLRDLIGPITEREIIESETPLSYYVMGILWPRRLEEHVRAEDKQAPDIEDDETLEDVLETEDESISFANKYKPSSIAISAMLSGSASVLSVSFEFARYIHSEEQRKENVPIHKYERVPLLLTSRFVVPDRCGSVFCESHDECSAAGVEITLHVRKIMNDGSKLITVSASNIAAASQERISQNEKSLFQCRLKISSKPAFLPLYRDASMCHECDIEELVGSMLYRDVLNYAYGHGCSVDYLETDCGVFDIYSDFMPTERVFQMMPGSVTDSEILRLEYWRTADRTKSCSLLSEFIAEYKSWSMVQRKMSGTMSEHGRASQISIDRIDTCIFRLESGVRVLKTNTDAWESFLLMNEAMLLQRIKTKKCDKSQVSWYPFQLAYIVQIIPDIVENYSPFRNTVDLLWFPTGGGKTEAYFGVASFVIFYRRLSKKLHMDGVTIFMRYTLRLLTLQQFERASALICACEYLRRIKGIQGGEISIGLWIGSNMTPNSLKDASEKLEELRNDPHKKIYEGNPAQVSDCPWCGAPIDILCYSVERVMLIRCANNKSCDFHGGLPIYLIDDDIYTQRPTLVLATIDKFARITWEERASSLFGVGGEPPELIIQDELHLISGPLGSLAGVYEIAIEHLCTVNGVCPKVIASTATVKNAAQQIKRLYCRDMLQFPPNGISHTDSFFAVQADERQRPARTYIGLCETGGNLTDLLIRVYANLMFMKKLFIKQGKPEDVIDQFYTMVGYFNALKDLGASSNIINDRVNSYVRTLLQRKFKEESESVGLGVMDFPHYTRHDELTSRKTAKEIKETLELLNLKYTEAACFSYVLASNMLSVGIDISRLGLMAVYNQPKSNSEYIQATSRVGRQNPGLVLVLYNSMRSRDKSHYEQFSYYHKAFYRYVEATSVTPFSARAIEKALHSVFIALVRLSIPEMSSNDAASKFRMSLNGIDEIMDFIFARVRDVQPQSLSFAREWLTAVAEEWERLAKINHDTLVYKSSGNALSLLNSAENDFKLPFPAVLNSLRNVEASSNIFIQRRERP